MTLFFTIVAVISILILFFCWMLNLPETRKVFNKSFQLSFDISFLVMMVFLFGSDRLFGSILLNEVNLCIVLSVVWIACPAYIIYRHFHALKKEWLYEILHKEYPQKEYESTGT